MYKKKNKVKNRYNLDSDSYIESFVKQYKVGFIILEDRAIAWDVVKEIRIDEQCTSYKYYTEYGLYHEEKTGLYYELNAELYTGEVITLASDSEKEFVQVLYDRLLDRLSKNATYDSRKKDS